MFLNKREKWCEDICKVDVNALNHIKDLLKTVKNKKHSITGNLQTINFVKTAERK